MVLKKFVFLSLSILAFNGFIFANEKLLQANQLFERGLHSTTLLERKQALNQALSMFNEELQQNSCSPSLYASIADCYYLLDEYAWSILFNYRALNLDPHNSDVQTHLKLAQEKLGLALQLETSPINKILSINHSFSLPQRSLFFFLLTLAVLICGLLIIWFPSKLLRRLALFLVIFDSLLLLNLLLSLYLTPIQGVLITPTGIYRQPNKQQPQLTYTPLTQGIKVQVFSTSYDGEWIKILDPQGHIGYIPFTTLRII